jgi:hypothetical protein
LGESRFRIDDGGQPLEEPFRIQAVNRKGFVEPVEAAEGTADAGHAVVEEQLGRGRPPAQEGGDAQP